MTEADEFEVFIAEDGEPGLRVKDFKNLLDLSRQREKDLIWMAEEDHAEIEKLTALLAELVDDERCMYDHHGFCQSHMQDAPCANKRAVDLLESYGT